MSELTDDMRRRADVLDFEAGETATAALLRNGADRIDELERDNADMSRAHGEAWSRAFLAESKLEALESAREQGRATLALLPRLLKAAKYYEREKQCWAPGDDEHDDIIEEAERLLAPQADAERGKLSLSDCHLCGQFREHGHDCATPTPTKR